MTTRAFQTIIVVLTQIATIAATDMMLPSLPSLTHFFGVSDEAVQLAIPLFLTGAFIAAPILGILSDHFGRKPIMLWGIALFIVGSLILFLFAVSSLFSGRHTSKRSFAKCPVSTKTDIGHHYSQ